MKILTISKTRYKKALEQERKRAREKGHLIGCVQVYNKALSLVRNAAAGGQAPTRKMPRRLHNTVVEEMMAFGEHVVQQVVDQIDTRKRAGKKKLRVRFNGIFRPSRLTTRPHR